MVTTAQRPDAPPQRDTYAVAKRIDTASWGIFFLWMGYTLLAGVSIGLGFLGVGLIALITQGVRKAAALPVEGFWVLVGMAFVVGGLWNLLSLELPLAPFALLGVGALLVAGAVVKKR